MARTDKIKIRAQSSSFWPWRIAYRISPIVTLTYKDMFSTCFCCSTTTATKCYFLQFKEKRTYNGLPDFMTTVAREELNKLSSSITECNVIYLPQVIFTSIEISEFVFLCTNAYFPIFFSPLFWRISSHRSLAICWQSLGHRRWKKRMILPWMVYNLWWDGFL